jgi:hypothetical protein
MRSLLSLVYLAIGVVVAYSHQYLAQAHDLKSAASAVLAILLWPLVLLGLNLHLGALLRP